MFPDSFLFHQSKCNNETSVNQCNGKPMNLNVNMKLPLLAGVYMRHFYYCRIEWKHLFSSNWLYFHDWASSTSEALDSPSFLTELFSLPDILFQLLGKWKTMYDLSSITFNVFIYCSSPWSPVFEAVSTFVIFKIFTFWTTPKVPLPAIPSFRNTILTDPTSCLP